METATGRHWWVQHGELTLGPYDLAEMQYGIGRRHIDPADPVCVEGTQQWGRADEDDALRPLFALPLAFSTPPPPPPVHSAPESEWPEPVARPEPTVQWAPDAQFLARQSSTHPPRSAGKPPESISPAGWVVLATLLSAALGVAVSATQNGARLHPSVPLVTSHAEAPALPTVPPPPSPHPRVEAPVPASAPAPAPAAPALSELPGQAAFWHRPELVSMTSTCPEGIWSFFRQRTPGANEFERHANELRREGYSQRLRGQTFVLGLQSDDITLGEYDFNRSAFPLVVRMSANSSCDSTDVEAEPSLPLGPPPGERESGSVLFGWGDVRLHTDFHPDIGQYDYSVGIACPRHVILATDCVHPYRWSASTTFWVPVAERDAPTFRESLTGTVRGQMAFQITSARTDRSRQEFYVRRSQGRILCGFHAGAGPLLVGRPVAVLVTQGQRVLYQSTPGMSVPAPTPRPTPRTDAQEVGRLLREEPPRRRRAPVGTNGMRYKE